LQSSVVVGSMRATPVEAYDTVTGKPAHLFPSLLAAEAAGFTRKSIHRCITGARRTHGGFAWRIAPPEAGTAEFALNSTEDADGDRILLDEFLVRFRLAVRKPVDEHAVTKRLRWAGIIVGTIPAGLRTDHRGVTRQVCADALIGRKWRVAA
jgi:hypothetical protein